MSVCQLRKWEILLTNWNIWWEYSVLSESHEFVWTFSEFLTFKIKFHLFVTSTESWQIIEILSAWRFLGFVELWILIGCLWRSFAFKLYMHLNILKLEFIVLFQQILKLKYFINLWRRLTILNLRIENCKSHRILFHLSF